MTIEKEFNNLNDFHVPYKIIDRTARTMRNPISIESNLEDHYLINKGLLSDVNNYVNAITVDLSNIKRDSLSINSLLNYNKNTKGSWISRYDNVYYRLDRVTRNVLNLLNLIQSAYEHDLELRD